jgi:pimeloyl-ACP methyl ester carboxylesterase
MGATSRDWSDGSEDAQANDISFEIDFAETLPDAEISEVGVIAYSMGGLSALLAAARDKRVDALISLDGSFRYAPGAVQNAGDVHPERVIELLHHVVFIAHNMPIFGCVGTVQANCVNFSEFCLLQVP